MTLARLRFAVALVAFLAWIGWLGYAYREKGRHRVVSRSQLLGATHLVVGEITPGDDGLPKTLRVTQTLSGEPVPPGEAEVLNLPSALPPGEPAFPGAGLYLVPLTSDGRTYRIADPAVSPGEVAGVAVRPRVYRWDDSTRTQIASLGVNPGG